MEANLSGADLSRANLGGARLDKAKLDFASLHTTQLQGARLTGSSLVNSSLAFANFTAADLGDATLVDADLYSAILNGTHVAGADFTGAKLAGTIITEIDLSTARGIDYLIHRGPSSIGIDTFYASGGNLPVQFMEGAGVPDSFIDYMPSLSRKPLDYFSCFLSHSHHDAFFCQRLYADLRANHVRTWYFPEDATWGKTVWGEIDQTIRVYDKLVVICSSESLRSGPVLREIERALGKEDKVGRDVLFPVRVDDYLFTGWDHERRSDVLAKVVGDFSGWDRDAAKYESAFRRLLKALRPD
jgi:hypothetical protein